MENKSGLIPLGRTVLVQPYIPTKKDSLIVMPDTVKERTMMIETRAVVLAIGSEAWVDETSPRAKVGQHVLIAKFAGATAIGPADGETYRLVNDRDIYCGIKGDSHE